MTARIKTLKFDKNIFFTSDHHFMHKNIIRYEDRPFESVEEMNRELASRWNQVVGKDDVIFLLGDFCFGGQQLWRFILKGLNGVKYLVPGNHDKSIVEECFVHTYPIMNLIVCGQRITLCHYPILSWYQRSRGAWHLHGHTHSKELPHQDPLRVNVGVDRWDFYPVSFNELKNKILNHE